jgi:hypothetical protein
MKISIDTPRWRFAFEVHPLVATGLFLGSSSTLVTVARLLG